MYKVPKLTELLLRDRLLGEIRKWYSPDMVVMDGSPLLNLTAWAVLYKEEHFNRDTCLKAMKILSSRGDEIEKDDPVFSQFPELAAIKRMRLNALKLPDVVVFLDLPPGISVTRIEKRGEKQQVHETPEKLSKLRDAYVLACDIIRDELELPTLTIDGNDSQENIASIAEAFIRSRLQAMEE